MHHALKRVQGTEQGVMFSNYSKLKDYNVNRNQLWNSILQQAISGKLVPQLDSEPEVEQVGPAPVQDEVPFELPAKWKWVQLCAVAEYNPKVDTNDDLEVSFVPLEKLSWAYDLEPTFDQTKPWGAVKKGYKRFKDGDVIFAKITPSFHNRKSGLVTKAYNGIGCGSTEFCVYRCQEQLLNKFLLWFFKSSYFINFGKRTYKGTAGQLRVNLDIINSMYLPLPPIEEQHRIVARLEEIRLLVEKFSEAQEQLVKLEAELPSKLKVSVLQQAIKGLLVPQLDSEPEVEQIGPAPKPEEVPFELPPKWKWVQLCAVAEYSPKVDANDALEVSFVPLEKLSWAYDLEPTFDQTKPWGTVKKGYKRFKDGDVIFAKITPSFHNRKSGLVTKACNGIGCGSTEFCVYRCQEQLLNKFLLWFFKSSYFINFGKRTYKGTAGQLRVNLDVINSMYLPLPPLEEQRRIVAKLEEVFAGVEKLGSLMEYA